MKRICIIVMLCFILVRVEAQCEKEIELEFIKRIESSGDSLAYHPSGGGSRGLYQITPGCLKDYNKRTGNTYTLDDLWKTKVNEQIARWMFEVRIPQMLKAYGYKNTINNQIICYNAGISYLTKKKEIPEITLAYIAKYKKYCKKSSK